MKSVQIWLERQTAGLITEPDSQRSISAFIQKTTRRLLLRETKRAVRDSYVEGDQHKVAKDGNPTLDTVLASEELHALQGLLAPLSPLDRQFIELRADGLTYREIARIQGGNVEALRQRVHRLRSRLAPQARGLRDLLQ